MAKFGQDLHATFEKVRRNVDKSTAAPRMLFMVSSSGMPLLKTMKDIQNFASSIVAAQTSLSHEQSASALLFATEFGRYHTAIKTWDDMLTVLKTVSDNAPQVAADLKFTSEINIKSTARIQDAINGIVRAGRAMDPRALDIFEHITGRERGINMISGNLMASAIDNVNAGTIVLSMLPPEISFKF